MSDERISMLLQRLSNRIIDTPLAESCGVDINVAKIIASFVIGIQRGDKVIAQWKTGDRWIHGTVTGVNGDGTLRVNYRVKYIDGWFWSACPRSKVRSLRHELRGGIFGKGDRVLIESRISTEVDSWCQGTIDRINGDGTFQVTFDNSYYSTLSKCPRSMLKHMNDLS